MSIAYPISRRRHTHTCSIYIYIHTHTLHVYIYTNTCPLPAFLTSMLLLFAARQHVSSPGRENAIWVGIFKVLSKVSHTFLLEMCAASVWKVFGLPRVIVTLATVAD